MSAWLRDRSILLPMLGLVVGCASWLPACGLILGLNAGSAIGDESPDAVGVTLADAQEDGKKVEDGAAGDADSTLSDAPSSSSPTTGDPTPVPGMDGSGEASLGPPQADACTPDPSWCDSHCGTGPDNCGESRQCASNCPQNYACGAKNTCDCKSETDWCTGRCGQTADNCGNGIDCGPCGVDACAPESTNEACGSRRCGQATNNCGQLVNCGVLGSELCSNLLQLCLDDGGCCSPMSARACGDMCETSATDGCGNSIQCPISCGSGRVCVSHTCCTRTDPCAGSCGVTLTDNCGQKVRCGCSGSDECVSNMCCTPSGCSANCVDSCGLPSDSCCDDAGADDADGDSDSGGHRRGGSQ